MAGLVPLSLPRRYGRSSSSRLETRTEECNARASLRGLLNPRGEMKVWRSNPVTDWGPCGPVPMGLAPGIEVEHVCYDPKGSELYLRRLKSGETLMEDRRVANVQIAR